MAPLFFSFRVFVSVNQVEQESTAEGSASFFLFRFLHYLSHLEKQDFNKLQIKVTPAAITR